MGITPARSNAKHYMLGDKCNNIYQRARAAVSGPPPANGIQMPEEDYVDYPQGMQYLNSLTQARLEKCRRRFEHLKSTPSPPPAGENLGVHLWICSVDAFGVVLSYDAVLVLRMLRQVLSLLLCFLRARLFYLLLR